MKINEKSMKTNENQRKSMKINENLSSGEREARLPLVALRGCACAFSAHRTQQENLFKSARFQEDGAWDAPRELEQIGVKQHIARDGPARPPQPNGATAHHGRHDRNRRLHLI